MHARLIRLTVSPDRVDEAIAFYRSTVVPAVGSQPGSAGAVLAVDRADGTLASMSLWQTPEAMEASRETALRLREQTERELAATPGSLEQTEVCHIEGTFEPGTATRVVSGHIPPERVGAFEQAFHDRVLPLVRSQRGFCRAAAYVNRETGTVIAASGWQTAADREASEAALVPLRRELAEQLGSSGPMRVELYELAHAEVELGAAARR